MGESFKNGLEVAIHSKLDSLSTDCHFAANLRLDINEFPNNCEDMPVPVSLEKLKKLTCEISKGNNKPDQTDRSKHLLKSKKLWPIMGQELLTEYGFTALAEKYSETLPALTNKMLRLMGLDPLVFKVKSTLDCVIICGTGHSHDNWSGNLKWSFVEDKAKGPFMKMVLQIPVEGGHEGGRSKVELNDQVRLYNVCDGSDRNYYLTTFYSDCEHIYEEVKFGYRLTMQFELELETTPLLSSLSPSVDLNTFLAVNDVQKTLAHWAPTEKNQPSMLVLFLEHRYAPSEFNFGRLKGKDRLLARLLLSVGTVDMYLAQLPKTFFGPLNETPSEEESVETDEENSETQRPIANCLCCEQKRCKCLGQETQTISDVVYPLIGVYVEIASLTCFDGRIVECRPLLKVDIDANVIPFNHSLYTLQCNCLKIDGDSLDPSNLRYVFHPRSVLVISPKNSLDLMLSCNFTVELDQLEANQNIRDLNRVITFCLDFPDKFWLEAVDLEERTRRLVSICLQFDTQYSGVRLLRRLAYNFPGQYGGLRSKAIAIGVARLIKKVGFTCSDFMSHLVSEHRALEQIENFAHLVMELYNVDLKDVAENIGSKCVTFLYSKSKNLMPSLSVSTLVTCAAMVFRMYEENPLVRGLVTLHTLITFGDGLELLPLSMLFFVIEGIQTTCRSQLDNIQECQKMQQGLHRKLLSYFIPEALAEEVMLSYLKLDDAILLKKITQTWNYLEEEDALAIGCVFRVMYRTSSGVLYASSAEHPETFPTTTGWSGKRPMQTHQRYLRGPKLQLSPEDTDWLCVLCDTWNFVHDGGGGRGGGGRGGGGGDFGELDWKCARCGKWNHERRTHCFKCLAERTTGHVPDEDWDMESCDPAPHPENQQHLVGISVSTQTDPFFNVPVTFAPESWNLMEQLLVGTNLSEYSGVFRANHIDLNMFSHMTEEDFNNIGITSFGAKKILLEAIKAMRG